MSRPGAIIKGEKRYVIEDLLGQGQFGKVYKGRQLETDLPVAIKIINLNNLTDTSYDLLQSEITTLGVLSSSGCQKYLLCLLDAFETKDYAYIVTEYLEGNTLKDYIGKLSNQQVFDVARYIAYGIKSLHDLDIAHLDLKLENIILNPETMKLDIVDFGFACRGYNCQHHPDILGTPKYLAPEVFDKTPSRNIEDRMARDIYAYGMILYQLASGHLANLRTYLDNPLRVIPPVLDPVKLEPFFRVISNCLMPAPDQRATIDQVIELLEASHI